MLFILPGLYALPRQLHNEVFKFNSMKNQCGEGIKVFSIQKITDKLSSNTVCLWVFVYKAYDCIMCVQYIGGCSVHRGVFSTSGDTMSTSGGYHEYIGGIS